LKTLTYRVITALGIKPRGLVQWPFEAFYTYGAVEPLTGESFFLIFSHLDSDCFQLFLDEFSQTYPDWLNVVHLDHGAFHKAKNLKIPEHVVLLFQPADSPDTNPIERVWQHLKKESSWVNFETLADLKENVCEQLNDLSHKIVASLAGYPFILSALESLNL
jgi:transposase